MSAFAFLLACLLMQMAKVTQEHDASRILDRYLAMPLTPNGRGARLEVLDELKSIPAKELPVVEKTLSGLTNSEQRYEIMIELESIAQDSEGAQLLHRVLLDVREPQDEESAAYEKSLRSLAASGLGFMAASTFRAGGQRHQYKPDSAPKVQGLLPYLIMAANDKAKEVRISAMYGLADSRNSLAVAELKNRLKDEDWEVRFYAACFLTEYQDDAGLPEMRTALGRLKESIPKNDYDIYFYTKVEMLVASFERITGKGFGWIPSGDSNFVPYDSVVKSTERLRELLDKWDAWWKERERK